MQFIHKKLVVYPLHPRYSVMVVAAATVIAMVEAVVLSISFLRVERDIPYARIPSGFFGSSVSE